MPIMNHVDLFDTAEPAGQSVRAPHVAPPRPHHFLSRTAFSRDVGLPADALGAASSTAVAPAGAAADDLSGLVVAPQPEPHPDEDVPLARVSDGTIRLQPFKSRETCANGHPWTPETTRWRTRGDRGKHTAAVERDCLLCKRESEARRRKRRTAEQAKARRRS